MVHQRRRFGNWGEEAAVRYLEKQGYEILDRNYRSSWGEITSLPGTGECWPLWK